MTVGAQLQNGHTVLGLAADIDWGNITGSSSGTMNFNGAPIGTATLSSTLSSGTGAFNSPPCISQSELHIGLAAGAGIEYGITQNLSAKGEWIWVVAGAGNTLKDINWRFGMCATRPACHEIALVLGVCVNLSFIERCDMTVGNSRKQTGVLLVACVAAVVGCLYAAQAKSQNLPNPIFRPTIEDVDPGIDHGNSYRNLPETYQRQAVFYRSQEPPGTIIVETSERHLYLIQSETRAVRYGIGVGRGGFTWQGLLKVSRKAEWPDWHPPPEMIERQPYLPRFMAGGPGNPMGARAMYLGATIYRIHGTNAPETIGQAVSSGCFRLVNDDVVDLYERVPVGTRVVVRQH